MDHTMLPDYQEVLANCPGCGSANIKLESEQNAIFSCSDCTLLFTNPRPNQEFVVKNYCEGEYYARFMPDSNWAGMWKRRTARVLKRLKSGRLLDVGAGIGTQLSMLKQHGLDVVGTEISTEAIAKAKALYGIDLLRGYVEDQAIEDESLDAITMWHVFEHLPYPGRTLAHLAKKLKKGGLIFIAVPNNDTDRLILSPSSWFASRKEKLERLISAVPYEKTFSEIHLLHFTPRSLRNILENQGFSIVELSLDNISLRPSLTKDAKYFVRNFLARQFGLFAHKALFVCAVKRV